MFCTNCGKDNQNNTFCGNCGNKIEQQKETTQTQQPTKSNFNIDLTQPNQKRNKKTLIIGIAIILIIAITITSIFIVENQSTETERIEYRQERIRHADFITRHTYNLQGLQNIGTNIYIRPRGIFEDFSFTIIFRDSNGNTLHSRNELMSSPKQGNEYRFIFNIIQTGLWSYWTIQINGGTVWVHVQSMIIGNERHRVDGGINVYKRQ